jgi:hypothetical protein
MKTYKSKKLESGYYLIDNNWIIRKMHYGDWEIYTAKNQDECICDNCWAVGMSTKKQALNYLLRDTNKKMKHTKRKWRVAEFIRENAPNIVSVMSGTDTIVDLPETNNKREIAKLISKAPEMYEALKWTYDKLAKVSTSYPSRDTIESQSKMASIRSLLKEIES